MTGKQTEIYNGLKVIGPEIAQFYKDGLDIIDSSLGTKSNLLGHLLREIDGGLRDVFEQNQLKRHLQSKLRKEDLEKLYNKFKDDYKSFDYLANTTFEEFKEAKGHISSIMASFGFGLDHPISVKYIKVVRWMAKYAHRSGAYNDPRNPSDIINLWNEFEDVLSKLIGNYYALANRIDSILSLEKPREEILKTLPNLLNTESRFVYFFNGLESPRWLLPLEKEGYFKGSNNPEPVEIKHDPGYFSIPLWGVLVYLEKVALLNMVTPDKEISESLVSIVDNISLYRKENGIRIENYHTDHSVFKIICALPEVYIEGKHFEFIGSSLKGKWMSYIGHSYSEFLDRLLVIGNKSLLLQSVQLLISYRVFEDQFDKIHSIFKDYELQNILSVYKPQLIPVLGEDILKLGLKLIDQVCILDESAFSTLSLPAIEDHEQTMFTEKYECQLVYLVRDTLETVKQDVISETLKVLIESKYSILQRLAFHTIRLRYDEFSDVFWNINQNPLDISQAKHEIYELLKEHSAKFNKSRIDKALEWIENKEYFVPDEVDKDPERIAKSIAYRKKEWLGSLESTHSEIVSKQLKIVNAINDAIVDHPGFNSWHSGLIGNVSPLSLNEINNKNIEETIEYFEEFIKQDHPFLGPSVDGLIDMITRTVRKNPAKYNKTCASLINAPSQIKYAWIRGLNESWKDEKAKFECEEVFRTAKAILEKEEFWKSHNTGDSYNRWFTSALLSFIEDGLRDDNHAFETKNLPVIKETLLIIYDKDTSSVSNVKDLATTALNNTKGKIYSTFFQYSLRLARSEGKVVERWDHDIKELINQGIRKGEENPLLFHVIGQFLPNIEYLDEKWMIENFNDLFPKENEVNWSASMNGYFFYHRVLNKIHLDLFLKGSHISKAISEEGVTGEAKKVLILQICTAYLYNFESFDLQSETIQSLISSNNKRTYSSLIYNFWSPRFHIDAGLVHRIKPIWKLLYKKAIKLEDEEIDHFVLSGCCKWINSIEQIDDDIFEILIDSMVYVNQQDRYSVIESLAKHIYKSTEKVGKILIELFSREVNYDITRGKLKEMAEVIYEKGFKEIGDKICLLHGEKGIHFLRDVYTRFNL